jgi:Family of unknown function (DUF6353)
MKLIPYSVTRSLANSVVKTKRNSPHIFFAGGVLGIFASTFLACKATLKLEETVDEIRNDLDKAKSKKHLEQTSLLKETQEQTYRRELVHVYGTSAIKIGKLYAPAAILGVASVGALTGSHVQLARRNAALTATLAAVSEAYDKYRSRVREELGEERELDIYRGIKEEEVEDEKGKKHLVKVVGIEDLSPYARFFDEQSTAWQKDAEHNRVFLSCQQEYFNHRLNAYGFVFLNEVYEGLGFERTREGQIVGWLRPADGGIDGYIDFGMYEAYNKRFINLNERSVILDFNVDGPIQHKI